ncbi:MAG: hypothetical protein NTZ79_16715 [Proteobacteria bacterium]|nr:hypothetical protein [Pseudomonadota bacterium]
MNSSASNGPSWELCAQVLQQVGAVQQARARILAHRLGQALLHVGRVAATARDAEVDDGFVAELALREHHFQRQQRAVCEACRDAQRVIGPLARGAGRQATFQRGVRVAIEEVHDRLAEYGIGVRKAEQFQPGGVGIHHDAFLHLRDGVRRAFHERGQSTLVLAGRGDGLVQCPLKAERAQFA